MTASDTPRTESRVWNPERYGHDVEGPCWECGQRVRYFVDEDGTPRNLVGIEAEAAQPAALDALDRVERRIYHGNRLDLSEARYYMDKDVEAAFDSERRRLAAEAKP